MVRRTRTRKRTRTRTRNGGMLGTLKKVAQPLGHATVILGKEYSKDWAQKKGPKIIKEIYNDPSSATDPTLILTGTKKMPTPTPIQLPKFDINDFDIEDSENVNPNIKKGGRRKTKRRKNLHKK